MRTRALVWVLRHILEEHSASLVKFSQWQSPRTKGRLSTAGRLVCSAPETK